MAVAALPVVQAHDVQVGNVRIPIGRIQTSSIFRKDDTGKEIHGVRIWTQGGMGLKGKGVLFDFQLQTAEKTHQFYQDLLAKAGASFSLHASSIKPNLVASGEGVKGVIEIQFQENHYCEEFDSAIAPVFFREFQRQVLNGNVLKLTSEEGTKDQITEKMNQSFEALNRQTHFQTAEFLHNNRDPRFYAQRQQEDRRVCPPHRDPHYFVALDGKVQKETPHRGKLPEGHFKKWDETDFLYFAPEPLEQLSEEEIAEMRKKTPVLLEYAIAISKISPRLAEEMASFIEELKKQQPRNVVEWELFYNLMEFSSYETTQEEYTALQEVFKTFKDRLEPK